MPWSPACLTAHSQSDFVRQCADPIRFVNITRRDSVKTGVLINETTGVEIPLPRLTRWYKARKSPFRIEHRWTDADGKEHTTTPPGATSIQLLMDLPEPGVMLGDVDYTWYVGEARQRIFAVRDGFLHLDPKWLSGIAADLHARGLAPSPHWAGKHSPKGARKDHPSYFWDWSRYSTFGTHTGPEVAVLVLDIDLPDKFRKWIEAPLWDPRDLDDCLVSYHRCDSPEAVRAGEAKGKLIFQFEVGADHPLARVGKAALRQALGIEIFYGHGDPSILGEHPDGPDAEYMLSDDPLGPPPDWLIADLVERAAKKVRAPKEPKAPSGNGNGATSNPAAVAKYAKVALESEVAKVAAAPEGERNTTVWKASCAIGGLVGAGVVDREEAEEKLIEATTLAVRGGGRRDPARVGPGSRSPPRPWACRPEWGWCRAAHDRDYDRGTLGQRSSHRGPRSRPRSLPARPSPSPSPPRGTPPRRHGTGRDPGGLTIAPIHAATLRERLTKYASWVKRKKGEDGERGLVPAHPPDWAVQAVPTAGSWKGLRCLEGVTEVPLSEPTAPSWILRDRIASSGSFTSPRSITRRSRTSPPWRMRSGREDDLRDRGGFPVQGPESPGGVAGGLADPPVRPAIHGSSPMFVFDANLAGTGKSMLVDIISLIAVGRCMGRTIYPASEEEMAKTMLAIALGGSRLVLFDNAATGYPIGGPTLDAALTAMSWSGRVLQVSKFATDVPLCATFFASGNNLGLKGDSLRRMVLSRLESPEERPEERDNFKIPRLLDHVRERAESSRPTP